MCRSGYRPLDRYEAEEQKSAGRSYVGAADHRAERNWVIMGPGYHGEIKQSEAAGPTFCYPNNDQS
ncbi:hypothetical protein O9929_21190 [Vibrio lentus]|nr:hypothetical protein [Vibrio lentus]